LPRDLWRLRNGATSIPRARPYAYAWRRLTSGPVSPNRAPATRNKLTSPHAAHHPERSDWRTTAEECGFDFHTIDGERYWDERGYYGFTLEEIERQIEEPSGEIDAMCLELVGHAIDDENYLRRLRIPEAFWPLIAESWHRDESSLYGRLDLSFDGRGPAKLLEYNADTPTSIFEAAVFQWTWLEQAIERNIIPKRADQFNSIHERLIDAWKKVTAGSHVHLTGTIENAEDAGTLAYLEDTARQGGLATTLIDIEAIGWRDGGGFIDLDDRPMELVFKLYPWEWMFQDAFGAKLADAPTRWLEPPWKTILSNKGILPLLWEMFPDHPNLLPAFFENDPNAARLGASFVRKPLYSREGANVALVSGGVTLVEQQGPYGAEGFIRQALAPLPNFSGQYPVVGSWLIDHTPCGLSVREDENPITGNTSRFLPHAIL
jgi:glutathionylspermidine synthase